MPVFATMNESEVAELTKLLYTRTYLPGVPIVRARDAGDAMYLIAGGEAAVMKGRGESVILREGDFVGERALIERRRHRHDVVAKTRAGSSCSMPRPCRASPAATRRSGPISVK